MRCLTFAAYCCLGILLSLTPKAQAREPLDLGGISLEIVEHRGWFLGLGGMKVERLPLQVADSLMFPLVVDEWGAVPRVASGLQLRAVEADAGGVTLTLALFAAGTPADWQAFFLWQDEAELPARDDYRFLRTRPLAEVSRRDARAAYIEAAADRLTPVGHIRWRLEPRRESFGGWDWQGLQWRFSLELENGMQTTALRLIGGPELGGTLEGLTLAIQRYRGLGDLEQRLNTDAEGRSASTFNTQDSFARPSPLPPGFVSGRSAFFSREEAMAIRNQSWIHTMARGAGTGFFDFQFRDQAALALFPARQGNHRALVEVYPGDPGLGQSHEEHFGAATAWQGDWMQLAVLRLPEARAPHFWRNRYLEVDRALRQRVSDELGFLQDAVVPSVGYLFDLWGPTDAFAPLVARMSSFAGDLAEMGVQRVMTHNPGWVNGRAAMRGWDGLSPEDHVGGGVNSVYDWTPLPRVRGPWRDLSEVYDALGIEHYVWLSGMSRRGGQFTLDVGLEPEHWTLNSPDGHPNDTYGVDLLKHNLLSPRFAEVWNQRFDDLQRDFGFAGFWGDSFQNLMMSQLNWSGGRGEPLQRAWWEWLAAQSQQGRGWISESHSFPGLSCSIETENWDRQPWMLGQVIRWLRGWDQGTRAPEAWGQLLFRMMAFDAWLAPEIWPYYATEEVHPEAVITGFRTHALAFRAARPLMQQPWILPEMRGVLWTAPAFPDVAVLFAFDRIRLPEGLIAHELLDPAAHPVSVAVPLQVTVLRGAHLLQAMDIEPPPSPAPAVWRTRPQTANLPETAPFLLWQQPPGIHRQAHWTAGSAGWQHGSGPANWPDAPGAWARFAPFTRTFLQVSGPVSARGLLTQTPGTALILDTLRDGEPGDLLEVHGPVAGPLDIYFRNTPRGPQGFYSPVREAVGLRFRGGGVRALRANLLPWPENFHLHSQIVSLSDPGTEVHFHGSWPATGELNRPGLILDEGTHFKVWPDAELPFIKNYGGFTLQWWVGRGQSGGGTLEFHPRFVADRSRDHVNPFLPHARDLRTDAIGSVRLNGVTLITHHHRNLPITGREQDAETGSIQNNGHLVFEHPHGGRWEVRSRSQRYAGAVWIDGDTVLDTQRDLLLNGVTEAADSRFAYTAANAFQTRRARGREDDIHIRKTGPAALILEGEQAYVPGSHLHVEAGTVVFRTDPAAGGTFPRGEPVEVPSLHLHLQAAGTTVWDTPAAGLGALTAAPGSRMVWAQPVTLHVVTAAQIGDAVLEAADLPPGRHLLLQAAALEGEFDLSTLPEGWTLSRERDADSEQLWLRIPPTAAEPE